MTYMIHDKAWYKSGLLWTIFLSLFGLACCLTYFILQKEAIFKWKDPTAEIRNVVLGMAAISGLPFLVFSHINKVNDLREKRNDLKLKRQDYLLKSESAALNLVLPQLDEGIELYKNCIKVSNEAASLSKSKTHHEFMMDSLDSLPESKEEQDLFKKSCIAFVHSFVVEENFSWSSFKRSVSSINGVVTYSSNLVNKELHNAVLMRISNSLTLEELELLYFLTILACIEDYYDLKTIVDDLRNGYVNFVKWGLEAPSLEGHIIYIDNCLLVELKSDGIETYPPG